MLKSSRRLSPTRRNSRKGKKTASEMVLVKSGPLDHFSVLSNGPYIVLR